MRSCRDKKKSGRVCCIMGCKSRESRNPELSFYGFPTKSWEIERRKKWIVAVCRITDGGKPWQPTKYSKICSLHFERGYKSEDPREAAYNPTIFPKIYNRRNVFESANRERRMKLTNKKHSFENTTSASLDFKEEIAVANDEASFPPNVHEASTQTDPDYTIDDAEAAFCYVWQDSSCCEVSTQSCIPVQDPSQKIRKNLIDKGTKKKTRFL